jgi:hypothetical protein
MVNGDWLLVIGYWWPLSAVEVLLVIGKKAKG